MSRRKNIHRFLITGVFETAEHCIIFELHFLVSKMFRVTIKMERKFFKKNSNEIEIVRQTSPKDGDYTNFVKSPLVVFDS